MSKNLTPSRRARLDTLATYLERLPKNYRHFRMAEFVSGEVGRAEVAKYAEHNGGVKTCGTAACAVGHGPAAGIFMPRSLITEFRNSYSATDRADVWAEYAKRMFVGDTFAQPFFEWCFGGNWGGVDNGHRGAAARIRYLLDHGKPPQDFRFAAAKHRKLYASYRIDAKAKADA